MQIPDTDNIHFQHAFKKGYRLALEGKSAGSMPSAIRRDMEMRSYFQLGWEQAEDDIALSVADSGKTDWRGRFAWGSMMLIGGISTTLLMLHNIQEEQVEQARLISGKPLQTEISVAQKIAIEPEKTTLVLATHQANDSIQEQGLGLGLLSSAQRSDLAAYQQEQQQSVAEQIPLQAIMQSDIKVSKAVFTEQIIDREPVTIFATSIPKYVREIKFYTQISHANNQTLSHRWRFNDQVLATIPLEIKSDDYRTWSSKKMSSAWQGTWHVEVLDTNQAVIYRKSFNYGNP